MCSRYDPARHHRRSIRLPGYDYAAAGAYLVTICTEDRRRLLARGDGARLRLTDAGRMVQATWSELPDRYAGVAVDAFVVMPDHVHGIVVLTGVADDADHDVDDVDPTPDDDPVGATPRGRPRPRAHAPPRAHDPRVGRSDVRPGRTAVGRPRGIDVGRPRDDAGRPPGVDTGRPRGVDTGRPRGVAPTESVGGSGRATASSSPLTLGDVVSRFKSLTTTRYADGVERLGWTPFPGRLWQRNYHERIVRDDRALAAIRRYIDGNPAAWIAARRASGA